MNLKIDTVGSIISKIADEIALHGSFEGYQAFNEEQNRKWMETRITRENGQRVLIKLGGTFSQMRFYVMEPHEMEYRPVPYRQGLEKVSITELAEIQQRFKRNEALLKGGRF